MIFFTDAITRKCSESKQSLQVLFVIILVTLQFEEHNIGDISVFRLIILPLSILGFLKTFSFKHNKRCKSVQILFLVLLTYLFIVCSFLGTISDSINKLLLIPFTLFLTFCFCDDEIKRVRYDRIFLWGPFASFIAWITGYGYKETVRFCGIYFDPNFLCIFCILGAVSKIVFLPHIKNKWEKLIYIILLCIDLYEIFISQSRGGILVILIIGSIYIMKVVNNTIYRVLLMVPTIVIGFYIWNYAQTLTMWSSAYDNTADQILSRMKYSELESGGGRTGMWEKCINYINENGSFFVPVGHSNLYRYNGNFDTHNSFLDFLSDAGYFVFLVFFIPLLYHLLLFYRKNFSFSIPPEDVFLAMISIAMMLLSFFLSYYTWKIFWLPLIIAWCLPGKTSIHYKKLRLQTNDNNDKK